MKKREIPTRGLFFLVLVAVSGIKELEVIKEALSLEDARFLSEHGIDVEADADKKVLYLRVRR